MEEIFIVKIKRIVQKLFNFKYFFSCNQILIIQTIRHDSD
jgi:hypothetical protein